MKWLILGAGGMFGSDMYRMLHSMGENVTGFTRADLDLEIPQTEIEEAIKGYDIIVNAVAYTDVDGAELNPEHAQKINAEVPGKLALITGLSGQRLIHISTDYVFDGLSSVEYETFDMPNPANAYGKSKALGEKAVLAADPLSHVIRTSWLYGINGKSFPRTIAQRLLDGQPVEVVADQTGIPTWTMDLAQFVFHLVEEDLPAGIYHAVPRGATTWYDFAKFIAQTIKVNPELVTMRPFGAETIGAIRPPYSVLEQSRIGDFYINHWSKRFQIFAEELLMDLNGEFEEEEDEES